MSNASEEREIPNAHLNVDENIRFQTLRRSERCKSELSLGFPGQPSSFAVELCIENFFHPLVFKCSIVAKSL